MYENSDADLGGFQERSSEEWFFEGAVGVF